ncbi:MAG: heavy-metal-associated domain-containing protein [Burkholderiaceae bacterium]
MKSFTIKSIAAYVLATWTMAYLPLSFAAESVKVTVNGMVCAFCAQGIEKRLIKLPTTKAVFVDLKQRIVAVEAKEGQKPDDKIISAEITEAGYDVVKLQTSSLSVADIRAEMKAKK